MKPCHFSNNMLCTTSVSYTHLFKEKGFFVAVINPFEMKEYRCQGLRRVKTDKQDAITISHYGIDHWYRLKEYKAQENIYTELKLLGRQYCHYTVSYTHLIDEQTLEPGESASLEELKRNTDYQVEVKADGDFVMIRII